jgi:hypothetical protein
MRKLAMVNPNAPARAWTSGCGDTGLRFGLVTNDRLAMANPNAPARAWTSDYGDKGPGPDRKVLE